MREPVPPTPSSDGFRPICVATSASPTPAARAWRGAVAGATPTIRFDAERSIVMDLIATIGRLVDGYRRRRARRRTRMLADGLPETIQKDIGWRGFPPDEPSGRYDA
jgi:hypothetical protein